MGATPTAEGAAAQSGAPWAICITPPNAQGQQFLYSSDAFPGRIYKLSLDGKVLGWLGKSGHQAEAVRLDPRDRVPERERDLRRGAAQLAGAETHVEAGCCQEHGGRPVGLETGRSEWAGRAPRLPDLLRPPAPTCPLTDSISFAGS